MTIDRTARWTSIERLTAIVAQEINDAPAETLIKAAMDDAFREKSAEILKVGTAKGWSTWAAAYINPDVDFVDTGMPATETIVAELRRVDRAANFREAAEAIEAEQAREERAERERFGYLDHETVLQGAAVRAKAGFLRRMADNTERGKDTTGGDQPCEGESTPDFFQAGRIYTSRGAWTFKPTSIVDAPDGQRVALGFIHGDLTYGAGVWTAHGEYEFDGWRDITDETAHATGPDGASQ